MLLKLELDFPNENVRDLTTHSLVAKVLEYQAISSPEIPVHHSYRLDVRSLTFDLKELPVKIAILSNNIFSVELEEPEMEILNLYVASCEVVEDFPTPPPMTEFSFD